MAAAFCTKKWIRGLRFWLQNLSGIALSSSFILCSPGCHHAETPVEVVLHGDISDDEPYSRALSTATREASVYGDFETKVLIKATFLSPEFRNAFNIRYEKMMHENQFSLSAADRKAGFFISVFTPDGGGLDLNNRKLWALSLKTLSGQQYHPSMVQKLTNKKRWISFFPWLTKWSEEYLVLFDTEHAAADAAADAPDPEPSSSDAEDASSEVSAPWEIELSLANSDARISLRW